MSALPPIATNERTSCIGSFVPTTDSPRFSSDGRQVPRVPLVPRTRSSHRNCRESGCELRVQSGTRIIELLVPFDSEVRKRMCPQNDANFGIGALAGPREDDGKCAPYPSYLPPARRFQREDG